MIGAPCWHIAGFPISESTAQLLPVCFTRRFLSRAAAQVCTMPQNVTSYGGTRSSVHQHTSRSSHHGPRSTGWLNGVVRTGCQATAARSADVTARHASLTATLPRPLNAMASPADGVKSARPAAGVSMNGVTGPEGVTKNSKANQSRPKRRFKENGTKRRRMKNPTAAMSNPPVASPEGEEDWASEVIEVTADKWEKMFGVKPYGPEDVDLFALKDLTLTQEDSVIPASFQPAHDHPEPVQWLRLGASTEPDQFTDADH
ncbi:uncharacterized protein LOC142899606 isoform X3 [Nelusetta ayraudi]|uniref:uncharacterized protein LOC142899606 isoform X3 n=1 Tax=Nelusetta ayraudi TaxID=303726 RepID=UPI003F6E7393